MAKLLMLVSLSLVHFHFVYHFAVVPSTRLEHCEPERAADSPQRLFNREYEPVEVVPNWSQSVSSRRSRGEVKTNGRSKSSRNQEIIGTEFHVTTDKDRAA